jgi:hypothetical protein
MCRPKARCSQTAGQRARKVDVIDRSCEFWVMWVERMVGRVSVIFVAAALLGCGGEDDVEPAAPQCGTPAQPLILPLRDVKPAAAPLRWTNTPAAVVIDTQQLFQTDEGCTYAFPKPLFSYNVTAP